MHLCFEASWKVQQGPPVDDILDRARFKNMITTKDSSTSLYLRGVGNARHSTFVGKLDHSPCHLLRLRHAPSYVRCRVAPWLRHTGAPPYRNGSLGLAPGPATGWAPVMRGLAPGDGLIQNIATVHLCLVTHS